MVLFWYRLIHTNFQSCTKWQMGRISRRRWTIFCVYRIFMYRLYWCIWVVTSCCFVLCHRYVNCSSSVTPNTFLFAIIFLFTAFSFWGFATNGIRNGMATSIAMVGLTFFCRHKRQLIIGYIILLVAINTHKSTMLVAGAATIALFSLIHVIILLSGCAALF